MKRKFREPTRKMSYATRIVIVICLGIFAYLAYTLYAIHVEMKENEAKQIELDRQYKMLGQDYKL